MSLFPLARKTCLCWALAAAAPLAAPAQTVFAPQASEYSISGPLPGDQVNPQVAVKPSGGYLVWEDNVTDGYGEGISAVRLDNSFSATFAPFRVNMTAAGDQERPVVTLLSNGGAAFAWQGGARSSQHIYGRFLSSTNTWLNTNDVQINTGGRSQVNPALTTLANGNVIVVWGSYNQVSTTSLQDVYGQILSATGQKIGTEFLINQFTTYNQRTPVVAGLSDGRFVVVWVSEQQRADLAVDIYARLFTTNGTPTGNEFIVDNTTNVCANPSVAAGPNGGFAIAWGQKDLTTRTNGWDVFSRVYSAAGVGGAIRQANAFAFGDQFAPRIGALPDGYLMVWTSMGQDGSWEGVFGRFLDASGTLMASQEFGVNATTASRQMYPALASDGSGRFLVSWSSFTGPDHGMDLYAQRYVDVSQPLSPMDAPYLWVPFVISNGIYQPQIRVSWPALSGFSVDHFDVYVDGAVSPTATLTSNVWVMTATNGLTANSTHTFQIDYVLADGRRSPLSAVATATTWMGYSWYGQIPFEWMASYFGYDTSTWPAPNGAVAPGGPTVLQVFLTGANPLNSSTWLSTSLVRTPQGFFLTWNPQPGLVYQVQTSGDLHGWGDVGAPRFAAGNTDSVYVGQSNTAYYRVYKLR